MARRLGAAHAAWLRRSPAHSWLSRDWLRDYTTSRPVREPVPWDHPHAVAAWPEPLREDLRRLWERRYAVLDAADRLPHTLSHHDVWPMNLIVDGSGPVLLDWAFIGPGPVGEDAANLVLDTYFDGLVDVSTLDEMVAAVGDGYRAGLADAVDGETVRRAIALTAAAKYFWLAPRMLTQVPVAQSYDSRTDEAMFAGRRPVFEQLIRWTRAALG